MNVVYCLVVWFGMGGLACWLDTRKGIRNPPLFYFMGFIVGVVCTILFP